MTLPMTRQTTKPIKTYIDIYKTFDRKDELTQHEFRLILKYFHNLIRKSLIYEGKIYTLPMFLGSIGILARKPTKYKIFDYEHYKRSGEKVYRLNNHASGLIARVHRILPEFVPVKHMYKPALRAFRFEACRSLNRELAKVIINENTIGLYLEYELRQH